MGLWAVGVPAYCVYAALTRDVEYRSAGKKQHEMVDLRNPKPLKLITINEEYRPNNELADLLDDINKSQKKGQGRACNCD
ncbi:hypothetical protein R5R35_009946 [Gryllus longicercus]|uniref:Uncharacterized protein n=1 Tax=Gryllus longicercus TaxID=2509291 RepID=A0AAN9VJ20_9ORTH